MSKQTRPVSPAPDTGRARERAGRSNLSGVLRIVAFFCLIGTIAFVLQAIINSGLRRIKTSGFGASNMAMMGKANAEIVINGSSRALSHYDPRIIQRITGKSTYNLGRNGSQIDMQLAFLSAYLKHNAKPALVVQNLDLFSFVVTHEGEVYDPAQYMPYLYEDDLYRALRRINPDACKWRYIPLYGYAAVDMRFTWLTGLKGFFGWNPREDFYLGFNPRKGTWTDDFEHYKAQNPNGVKFQIEPDGIREMEALMTLCSSRHIPLMLVYSPEYYEMQAIETNRPEIIARFQELARRFNVRFLDYSDSQLSRQRELFNNSQHLNAEGAAAFSEDFAKRLANDSLPYNSAEFLGEHAKQ